MIPVQSREALDYRLARYYLDKLRTAEAAYQCGHENIEYALAQFDAEWLQIKKWRDRAAEYAGESDDIAALCSEYPQAGAGLLTLRQPPHERLEWIQAGLKVARRRGDTGSEMILLYLLGRTLSVLRALADAEDAAAKGLALAREMDNPLYISRFLVTLGNIYHYQDEYEQSQTANEQALAISTLLGAQNEMGQALNGLGNIALSRSDDVRAFDCYSRYLAISEARGQPHSIALALRNLSLVTIYMGEYSLAESYAERCLAVSRASGDQSHLGPVLSHLGDLAWIRGDFAQACDYYRESIDVARMMSRPSDESSTLNQLGDLLGRTGDYPAAIEALEQSLMLVRRTGERWYGMMALAHLTDIYRRMGDFRQSLQRLREGLEIVSTVRSNGIRALYVVKTAQLWYAQGRAEQPATWMGLIQQHRSELIAHHRTDYDALCGELERHLGQQRFAGAFERGKTLRLDTTIQELLHDLTEKNQAGIL